MAGCQRYTSAESATSVQKSTGEIWITNPDRSALFQRQAVPLAFGTATTSEQPVIEVNEQETYQEIDGFGFTLTGGSAMHMIRMNPAKRAAMLKELFATDGNNIGISYLRLSIGASDLNERVFSYNDLPAGQTDANMEKFDLGPDREDVIPVLKEILAINPNIKILGSPWSPPAWMKTNNDTRGGSLKPEWYDAYATYFVRYVQDMKKEGIKIDAITVQNEPLHPGNNPSLLMLADEQALFVKKHLGPAFKAANIDTKIIVYDHNADRPDYPISILDDPEAKQYIDGSAFHLYGGKIEALSEVHNAHPDKHLYFTEQWMGAPGNLEKDMANHIKNLTIGATRNWSRNVLEWNLANDPNNKPYTDRGGCDRCLGGITIDKDEFTRNPAYYVVAHASKFVRPGSVRIESNYLDELPNVAFKTPEGRTVLIVLNDSKADSTFGIRSQGKTANVKLNAGAVATYVW
ncbi:glycoside hydrolase family 30 beta sandwich domain-containing protein [Pontibacter sp. SGAir0037]|uniref:glycoside hydrolase family 30 protein n=1 Tax=Pontibacter sp. SGAir0037 TaxID=2571030 RepID=UPI0010CCC054|nr:glycoside hydrolase family 30 beta sandwich domain-containing protein [Pontibacter sp. SGAir0037]QCR23254.1 glucosylceramidase [Pontibacter sp. SGAir0037]